MAKKWFFIFLGWVLIAPVWAEEPASPIEITLPENLLSQMEKEYLGAKIAGRNDYCPEFEKTVLAYSEGKKGPWSYGTLTADFNGDGEKDYSLIARLKNKFLWLTALKNPTASGKPYQLFSLGAPEIAAEDEPARKKSEKICDGVFWLTPARSLSTYQKEKEIRVNPYPAVGIAADGVAAYSYWKEGQWHRFGYEQ